ncbi:MAG TPA: nuclease-related domain-containing protein [Tepidisphaeraceae bacterium]|nr:nuclease-related domain-containing protein [Tepidisphaeraceae bacterium]
MIQHSKAHRHGVAGKYGKDETGRRFRRIFDILLACAAYGCGTLGIVFGYFWKSYGPIGAALSVIVLIPAIYFAVRHLMEPLIDKLAKERLLHLRGRRAEILVAWILEDLGDEWHIFNSIKLEKQSDIDHVLVGPAGCFCISTKSQRGIFEGTANGLLYNGNQCDFAQQTLWQTMNLKDRLEVLMGKDVPFIQPVLAVPFGYTEHDACGNKVKLVHMENITERLAPLEGSPKKLSKDQIARVVKVMEMIQEGAADVYVRPDSPQERSR